MPPFCLIRDSLFDSFISQLSYGRTKEGRAEVGDERTESHDEALRDMPRKEFIYSKTD